MITECFSQYYFSHLKTSFSQWRELEAELARLHEVTEDHVAVLDQISIMSKE